MIMVYLAKMLKVCVKHGKKSPGLANTKRFYWKSDNIRGE